MNKIVLLIQYGLHVLRIWFYISFKKISYVLEEKFTIPASYSDVGTLNSQIRSILKENNITSRICDDIELSLHESLNNIIKHAYGEQPGKTIDIFLRITKEKIEIKMLDEGKRRTNFKKPELKINFKDIDSLPESGMGLYIIDKLMTETKYFSREGKNEYTLIKSLTK